MCLAALLAYAAGRSAAYPGLGLPVFVLTFDITLNNSRRVALVALFTSAAAIAFSLALQPAHVAPPANWIASELGVLVAWLAGRNLRHSRARWAELQPRAERLEREREEQDRRAVTEERLRIARDLHDVIAHSMSVIAVQSAVGLHVMDSQPAQVRQALAAIEATSRSALTEMRALSACCARRARRAAAGPRAWPGRPRLLISQVQDAGLWVRISADGQRGTIPPGIDLSAYRIIQEALTNVIKHAGSPSPRSQSSTASTR